MVCEHRCFRYLKDCTIKKLEKLVEVKAFVFVRMGMVPTQTDYNCTIRTSWCSRNVGLINVFFDTALITYCNFFHNVIPIFVLKERFEIEYSGFRKILLQSLMVKFGIWSEPDENLSLNLKTALAITSSSDIMKTEFLTGNFHETPKENVLESLKTQINID